MHVLIISWKTTKINIKKCCKINYVVADFIKIKSVDYHHTLFNNNNKEITMHFEKNFRKEPISIAQQLLLIYCRNALLFNSSLASGDKDCNFSLINFPNKSLVSKLAALSCRFVHCSLYIKRKEFIKISPLWLYILCISFLYFSSAGIQQISYFKQ